MWGLAKFRVSIWSRPFQLSLEKRVNLSYLLLQIAQCSS